MLQQQASVHEQTVRDPGCWMPTAKSRRRGAARQGRSSKVTVIKVDPRVWSKALELAGGDASRIRVVTAEEVIVR